MGFLKCDDSDKTIPPNRGVNNVYARSFSYCQPPYIDFYKAQQRVSLKMQQSAKHVFMVYSILFNITIATNSD